MQVTTPIHGTYNYWLVTTSLVIAVVTSYAALSLAARVAARRGVARSAWLAGGALAMGSGIWSMHYIGMLAFGLPIPVYYHLPTVALSLLTAIAASYIALYVVSRERMTSAHVAAGSLLMGVGIATMHYTGMGAMRMASVPRYNPALFALSVALAVAISLVGLLLLFHSRDENRGLRFKIGSAVAMGLAISSMHYTGMAAVSFFAGGTAPDISRCVGISGVATLAILLVTCLILGFALLISLTDRRISVQHFLLENERQMLRALIDNIPDCMYIKDLNCRFVIANAHLGGLVGVERPDELLGKSDADFFAREIAEGFHKDDVAVLQSGRPLFDREEKSIGCNGNETHTLTTKVPLYDAKGRVTGLAGVGRDITARKAMEDALREAEAKYRGIFDEAVIGIFQLAPDGRFLDVNPAMARIFGYTTPEEMIASFHLGSYACHPDSGGRDVFAGALEAGGVRDFECQMVRRDGSRIWVSLNIQPVRRDGVTLRYEGMGEDISERKVLRDQLLQAQKLESVGQLAAGIAHEINTPTQYIEHNLHFLSDALGDLRSLIERYHRLLADADANALTRETIEEVKSAVGAADAEYLLAEIPKTLAQMFEGVSRVSTLVGAMKEFSHPGKKEKVFLDLNHAIENTITIARNEWKSVAVMETSLDPGLPAVFCHPGEFNQVILVLIVNAAQAIAEASVKAPRAMGTIRVETRSSDGWVEIRVQDNGGGVPENVRSRIFDPFFTTKEIGEGTGQGLAIARSAIVDRHAGSIAFESSEGRGTTFIVRIPVDARTIAMKAA